MSRLQRSLSRLAVFSLLALGASPLWAQLCPDQLLFSFGDFYYYSVKDCVTGAAGSKVYVYGQLVATGCNGQNGCNAAAKPYSILEESTVVGDPYDPNKVAAEAPSEEAEKTVFEKVPSGAELLTPWARNTISMYGGYPKLVEVQIDGQARYFKVFRVALQGNPKPLGFGTEVEGPAQNETRLPGKFVGTSSGIVRFELNDGFNTIEFKALYELPADPQPLGSAGGTGPK